MYEDELKRRITNVEIKQDKLLEDHMELAQSHAELQTIVMGPLPDRSNGIRGNLRLLDKRLDAALRSVSNLWNVRRIKECIGKEEVEKLRGEIAAADKNRTEVAVAQTNLKGIYVMGALQFAGSILVALIASGKIF